MHEEVTLVTKKPTIAHVTSSIKSKKDKKTKGYRTAKLQFYQYNFYPPRQQMYYPVAPTQYTVPTVEKRETSVPKELSVEYLLKEPIHPKKPAFEIVSQGRIPYVPYPTDYLFTNVQYRQ